MHSYYGTEEDGLDFSKTNQRLAVAVIGWDWKTKYDPKYVRLMANYFSYEKDGTENILNLPLHACKEEDWA